MTTNNDEGVKVTLHHDYSAQSQPSQRELIHPSLEQQIMCELAECDASLDVKVQGGSGSKSDEKLTVNMWRYSILSHRLVPATGQILWLGTTTVSASI